MIAAADPARELRRLRQELAERDRTIAQQRDRIGALEAELQLARGAAGPAAPAALHLSAEWSYPRYLVQVFKQLGQVAPGRMTRQRYDALVEQLARIEVDIWLLSEEPSIRSKVRLRLKPR